MTELELLYELRDHFEKKKEFHMEQYEFSKKRYDKTISIIEKLEGQVTSPSGSS